MKRGKGIFFVFLAALVLAASAYVPYSSASIPPPRPPVLPIVGGPFGGKILYVTYCTCSGNWGILIGPPRGGAFIYRLGATQLYANYNITVPGMWTLGIAIGTEPCLQVRKKGCSPDGIVPFGELMKIVGTS